MKFAHMGDCHLGGWRQPELRDLNFKSFEVAVDKCIKEKVDFVLITGDLFDSAYPPIETLKETFREFRKLKDSGILVFLIAGSHDYSASGKTFLDVLDKAGLCTNVANFEEKNGNLILLPTLCKNVAIYGYSGKKSSLEIEEIERIKLQDSPGLFKILMLHTAIRDAIGSLPVKAVDHTKLPKVDYLALSHLHINYNKENRVYSGPIFPNNISELEELKSGFFYIFDNGRARKEEIRLKEVLSSSIEIKDALKASDYIISSFDSLDVKDKIIILRLYGILEKGKTADIDFHKIESHLKKLGCFAFLKSTSRLHMPEPEIKLDILDVANIESQVIKKFEENNPNKFNPYINPLMKYLEIEKLEDEKLSVFQDRILSESRKVLQI